MATTMGFVHKEVRGGINHAHIIKGVMAIQILSILQKKLAATDKSMETIYAKMDGFSTAIKNQLSFNKMLETQLAQQAAATPAAELGKIPGQPESTLESVNVINAMWKEPVSRTPLSYAEKLTRLRRGAWGELAATV